MSLLQDIIDNKKTEVAAAQTTTPIEALREIIAASTRDFKGALKDGRQADAPRLIAEIKRRSPSKKAIREDLNVEEIVDTYQDFAAAISILTDTKFFGGSLEDLDTADHASPIPLLRKDFIVDEYQIFEARQFGADAILIIASILDSEKIEQFITTAKKLGLDCLVEVHDEADLKKTLATSAEIIGINNRNLDTLEIDLKTTHELVKKIPEKKIIVSESGISTRADVEQLTGVVDAILVGSSIMESKNISSKLSELTKK